MYYQLRPPAHHICVVCATAVSNSTGYSCVRHFSLHTNMLLLCAPLQSPTQGVTVVCTAAVSISICYCWVRRCSLLTKVSLCAKPQSPEVFSVKVHHSCNLLCPFRSCVTLSDPSLTPHRAEQHRSRRPGGEVSQLLLLHQAGGEVLRSAAAPAAPERDGPGDLEGRLDLR